MRASHVERFISFYETMSPDTLAGLTDVYSADAYFKDPFNEFNGVEKIEAIFRHMYRQVQDPRFVIREWSGTDNDGFVVWDMHFRSRYMRGNGEQTIHGVSHIRFDSSGKVKYHRDYWDTGEELYAKLPLLGWLIRRLRRMLA